MKIQQNVTKKSLESYGMMGDGVMEVGEKQKSIPKLIYSHDSFWCAFFPIVYKLIVVHFVV